MSQAAALLNSVIQNSTNVFNKDVTFKSNVNVDGHVVMTTDSEVNKAQKEVLQNLVNTYPNEERLAIQKGNNMPMTVSNKDTLDKNQIFYIYSMTKMITTVCCLKLHQMQVLNLEDPLYMHIDSMCSSIGETRVPKQYKVLKPVEGVENLFNANATGNQVVQSGGKTYVKTVMPGWGYPDVVNYFEAVPETTTATVALGLSEAIGRPISLWNRQYYVHMFGAPFAGYAGWVSQIAPLGYDSLANNFEKNKSLAQFVDDIAGCEYLAADPGEFNYGMGTDFAAQAALNAYNKANGTQLSWEQLVKLIVLDPLDMKDTFYYLSDMNDERISRIVPLTWLNADNTQTQLPLGTKAQVESGELPFGADLLPYQYGTGSSPNIYTKGSSGMYSTVEDYTKMVNMIRRYGVKDNGDRFMWKQTVKMLEFAYTRDIDLPAPIFAAFFPSPPNRPLNELGMYIGAGPTLNWTKATAKDYPNRINLLEIGSLAWSGWSGGRWIVNWETDTSVVSMSCYSGGSPGLSVRNAVRDATAKAAASELV